MRIALVGGGTGGHFYPLIAVAEAVRGRDMEKGENSELFYLGPDPYNKASLDELDIDNESYLQNLCWLKGKTCNPYPSLCSTMLYT